MKQIAWRRLTEALILVLVGAGIGYAWQEHFNPADVVGVREISSDYEFINPLLFVHVPEDHTSPEFAALRKRVDTYVTNAVSEGQAQDVSVYFRELNTSRWIAVHPEETFSPASMLKVATMIAVLRIAESNPGILSSTVIIRGEAGATDPGQSHYPPHDPVVRGRAYTVDELLQHLIVYSDNMANNALSELVGAEAIDKVYDDLRIQTFSDSGRTEYTAQEYSRLFRSLYNSTYLSRPLSESVLELLSKTSFSQGLVAGVPSGTVVSHKFGVGNIAPSTGAEVAIAHELHDCGIVYYPSNPYFLCVMTRGAELTDLEGVIRTVSHIVWEQVNENF